MNGNKGGGFMQKISSLANSYDSCWNYKAHEKSGTPILIVIKEVNTSDTIKLKEINQSSGARITPQNLNLCLFPLKHNMIINIESTQNQINVLRKFIGFNISEISNILLVKRPTIYEWLEANNTPSQRNQTRLAKIYNVFKDNLNTNLAFKNYIHKKILGDQTLFDLLKSEDLDEQLIKTVIEKIKKIALKQQELEKEKASLLAKEGFSPTSQEQKQKAFNRLIRKAI